MIFFVKCMAVQLTIGAVVFLIEMSGYKLIFYFSTIELSNKKNTIFLPNITFIKVYHSVILMHQSQSIILIIEKKMTNNVFSVY